MADPYATLGVARDADEATIKSAYRKLAKSLHPDRNQDNPKAAERFGVVTSAYDLLTDKDKRAAFDRGEIDEEGNPRMPFGFRPGAGGGPGGDPFGGGQRFEFAEGVDLGDIFDGLFGGGAGARAGAGTRTRRNAPPPRGANVAYRLTVPFTDAASGAPQRVTLADGKTIELKLPPGVESGTQIRLAGKGQEGPGGAGDAIVTLTIGEHPWFRREGDMIHLDLPITLSEALRGGKVRTPTVDGPVMLNIPPNASSGKTLRLKSKGFSRKGEGRGDQLVHLMIELPGDTAELARRLEGWSDPGNPRSGMGV